MSSTYAPAGKSLASVSVIGVPDMDDVELCAALKEELVGWFGEGTRAWTPLRTYRIPLAQPNQTTPTTLDRDARLGGGLYVCGDHRSPATFDGGDDVWEESGRGVHRGPRVTIGERESESAPGSAPRNVETRERECTRGEDGFQENFSLGNSPAVL